MPSRRELAFLLIALILSSTVACSNMPFVGDKPSLSANETISFIDLDLFDASLSNNMRARSELVTVKFPNQPVTINDFPIRLQKWLTAVHKHGGGVRIQTKEGYMRKDLMGVLSILISGYQLAKKSMPIVLGRNYEAVIVLESGDGVVGRVEFARL